MSQKYKGGAKRSGKKLRYSLIATEILDGIARRATLGAEKYGDDNWMKGDERFFKDAWDHLFAHYVKYKNGIPDEDDAQNPMAQLDAMAWNLHAIMWWERKKLDR